MYILNYFKQLRSNNLQNKLPINNLSAVMAIYKLLSLIYKIDQINFIRLFSVVLKFNNSHLSALNIVFTSLAQKLSFSAPISFTSHYSFRPSLYVLVSKSLITTRINLYKRLSNYTSAPLYKFITQFAARYSPTTVSKYLAPSFLNSLDILYLRKNKVFNKGRYSRNRQFYRTGVYWCLYVNIIAILGLNFWFYRFTINFGYLWWLFFISLGSFIIAKSFNFNLMNPFNLITSVISDLYFFTSILLNIIYNIYNHTSLVMSFSFFKEVVFLTSIIHKYSISTIWIFTSIDILIKKSNTFSIFLSNYSK